MRKNQSNSLFSCSIDNVVLGGTSQFGEYSCDPNEEDRQHILQRTAKLIPSLKV